MVSIAAFPYIATDVRPSDRESGPHMRHEAVVFGNLNRYHNAIGAMMKNRGTFPVAPLLSVLRVILLVTVTAIPAFAQFRVTAVTLYTPKEYLGPCPGTIAFHGTITATGTGEVTYRFVRSDGETGPAMTMRFDEPGPKELSTTWTLGGADAAAFEGWVSVQVLSPNALESTKAEFKLICTNVREGEKLLSGNPDANLPGMVNRADVTSKRGVRVGAKFVKWGGTVTLTKADAVLQPDGRYGYTLTYDLIDKGNVPVSTEFVNRFRNDSGAVLSEQPRLTLKAFESRQLTALAHLSPGTHVYTLSIDDDNVVAESDEKNNKLSVTIIVRE